MRGVRPFLALLVVAAGVGWWGGRGSTRAPRPDAAEASGITSNLASMEIQRVIDEAPADLKEYGLAEPRIEVSFKSGGQEHRLLIGQKTPPGSDLYAKLADKKKGFLVPAFP